MKYAVINSFGTVEVREDSYELPENAITLSDDDFNRLLSNTHILLNGLVVENPELLAK
jgi:hypothetical protein